MIHGFSTWNPWHLDLGFPVWFHQGMRRDECSGYLQHLIDHYEERSMAFHGIPWHSMAAGHHFEWLEKPGTQGIGSRDLFDWLKMFKPYIHYIYIYDLHGKIYGFRWRFSRLNQSTDDSEEPADYTLFFQADAADHLHWGYLSLVPCSRNQCNSPNNECPSKSRFVFATISYPYLGSWNNLDP